MTAHTVIWVLTFLAVLVLRNSMAACAVTPHRATPRNTFTSSAILILAHTMSTAASIMVPVMVP